MNQHPTVGTTTIVEEAACLLFESWLPPEWRRRKQTPDIHIDYRVEIVEGGEPSGFHFQAQIKGHQIKKGGDLSEPIKTKHLRYYLKCDEPVFLFVICPTEKKGNWIFLQKYLIDNGLQTLIRKQNTVSIKLNAQHSLGDLKSFREALEKARSYMNDLNPGSPTSAIAAEEKRLEQLDPRCKVEIAATANFKEVRITPRDAMGHSCAIEFAESSDLDIFKAFNEKGQAFEVDVASLKIRSPIMRELFSQVGSKLKIINGRRLHGYLEVVTEEPRSSFQVGGCWVMAPKRYYFCGTLSESPLEITLNYDVDTGIAECGIALSWSCWAGQPIRALAYFDQLEAFIRATSFSLQPFVRGNQMWDASALSLDCDTRRRATQAFDWLQGCGNAARHLNINPQFPSQLGEALESDDVCLLEELFRTGEHVQQNAGRTVHLTKKHPIDEAMPSGLIEEMILQEANRIFSFWGQKIKIGPLTHLWTMMKVGTLEVTESGQTKVECVGCMGSIYKITYQRPFGPLDA